MNLNRVLIAGNLTRDPTVKKLSSGTSVCSFGIAVNRGWSDQQGEKKSETTFVDCEAWGKTAETIGQYLTKGKPLFIEGRLKLDQWEDQDGSKRSRVKVVIEKFQFVGSKPDGVCF